MNLPRSTASPSAGSSAALLGKSGRKKCCNTITEHRALITCSEINVQLLHNSTVPLLRGFFAPQSLMFKRCWAGGTNSSFKSILLTGRKKDAVLFAMAISLFVCLFTCLFVPHVLPILQEENGPIIIPKTVLKSGL